MGRRPGRPELVGVALPVRLAQLPAPFALAPLGVVHCLSRWRLRPVSGCLLGCGAARMLLPQSARAASGARVLRLAAAGVRTLPVLRMRPARMALRRVDGVVEASR